jgi:hypothetical protein
MPSPSLVPTEHATPFYPRFAQMIGVTESLVFVQIRFMLSMAHFGIVRIGTKWGLFSYPELQDHFECFPPAPSKGNGGLVKQTLLQAN